MALWLRDEPPPLQVKPARLQDQPPSFQGGHSILQGEAHGSKLHHTSPLSASMASWLHGETACFLGEPPDRPSTGPESSWLLDEPVRLRAEDSWLVQSKRSRLQGETASLN